MEPERDLELEWKLESECESIPKLELEPERELLMATEIERKFTVLNDEWRRCVTGTWLIKQGYLTSGTEPTVRVRIVAAPGGTVRHTLTIKGAANGISRPEFEFAIPGGDALEMMGMCGGRIVKKLRHFAPSSLSGRAWEIDEFTEGHSGLVLAEIELDAPDQEVRLPEWVGSEVSNDPRYSNRSLAQHGLELLPRRAK